MIHTKDQTMNRESTSREWQPIETAPKDGTVVLLWGPYCINVTAAAYSRGQWVCSADGAQAIESQSDFGTELATFEVPTHWMPLPAPPQS